jgi:hypothetical protein
MVPRGERGAKGATDRSSNNDHKAPRAAKSFEKFMLGLMTPTRNPASIVCLRSSSPPPPNPGAPTAHTRRVHRRLVTEELHPREILPVRILHPSPHNRLVREVVGVLEVVRAHHQPRGCGGPPRPLAVVGPEMLVEAPPVDLLSQLHQGVPLVGQIRKSRPLHTHLTLILAVRAGSWLHPPILQEKRPKSTETLQYLDSGSSRKRRSYPHPPVFQDRLTKANGGGGEYTTDRTCGDDLTCQNPGLMR